MVENRPAWCDVLAERLRQINDEGWSPEHDDRHASGEMAGAAACYAMQNIDGIPDKLALRISDFVADFWPWAPSWWKPTDQRRNLIKAGALILAEIERLDRSYQPRPKRQRAITESRMR